MWNDIGIKKEGQLNKQLNKQDYFCIKKGFTHFNPDANNPYCKGEDKDRNPNSL